MKRLAHLGPDRARTWIDGPIALGHLMMQITREDARDTQPLHDADLSLVADVRLDNREELAEALAVNSHALVAMSDSDLLLAAYRAWGDKCVDHLLGDFAFAVWDAARQSLTMAVDHMGQRHLFYHQGEGFFAFASEIKGLWAIPQVPRTLIEERVAESLLLLPQSDVGSTDYVGIRSVPGGTVLTVSATGEVSTSRYWEPRPDPRHIGRDEAYYVQTYRDVLAEAVACRLRRSNHPAGLLMGGGFDSSAICALAGPALAEQGRKLIAVSSVMPENHQGSVRDARRWCETCRRDMPHLDMRYVTTENVDIFSFMEQAFLATDNRHSPRQPVTRQIFAEIAAGGARIVMDGHGGDYTINPRGTTSLVRLLRKGHIRRFVTEFRAMRRHLDQSVRQTFVRNVAMPAGIGSWAGMWIRRHNGLALWGPTLPLSRQLIEREQTQTRLKAARRDAGDPRAAMLAALRRQQNGPAQPYSIAAAAHGLEFTQPFHDKRVVELGLAIPEDLHVKNGRTRYLARLALKDLYPPEFQDRRPGSDSLMPGFLEMAKRCEPRLLAEIDRMEAAGRLSAYFDFPRMRAMLTRRRAEDHASGGELDTGQAMLTFIFARYIEWFRGDNA